MRRPLVHHGARRRGSVAARGDQGQSQMTSPQLRLLLPKSLATAGWDIVKSRRDVEGILFDDEDPPESLHPALRAVDGVALGHTHFGQAEISAAPRLRVVGRIGVGYDNVDVPALTRHPPDDDRHRELRERRRAHARVHAGLGEEGRRDGRDGARTRRALHPIPRHCSPDPRKAAD